MNSGYWTEFYHSWDSRLVQRSNVSHSERVVNWKSQKWNRKKQRLVIKDEPRLMKKHPNGKTFLLCFGSAEHYLKCEKGALLRYQKFPMRICHRRSVEEDMASSWKIKVDTKSQWQTLWLEPRIQIHYWILQNGRRTSLKLIVDYQVPKVFTWKECFY